MMVTTIDLSRMGLEGTLPTEFALLKSLKTLRLRGNKLLGTIPTEYYAIPSLRHLDLGENRLTDKLNLSSESLLETIDLTTNHFSGALPTSDWPRQLKSLDLSRNEFTGSFPAREMSQGMSHLEFLWLGNNDLTGSLPFNAEDWMAWSSSLEVLDLGSNLFTGSIPAGLSVLSSLKSLNLADNDLEGHLPAQLLQISSLWTVQLQDNALSGSIPEGLWSNLSHLGSLNLRNNALMGPISSSFYSGLQSNLKQYVCSDRSSRSLVSLLVLTLLTFLYSLDVSHNQLTGTIATELGLLRQLHTISAESNYLRGNLPDEMLDMVSLLCLACSEVLHSRSYSRGLLVSRNCFVSSSKFIRLTL